MESSSTTTKSGWVDMINESVHTSDDQDIGDVEAVSKDFIVVKRGFVNVHHYYIPVSKVEGWDGDVLWLRVTEDEVKRKYERNVNPDPYRYYVKDYAYYEAGYSPFLTIPRRYTPPIYPGATAPKRFIYKCDICDKEFPTADDFSNHVKAAH
ncbi:MAG TPA: DUF2171 domain-containing protein [Nitrososphaera sp.]|nr:DUF2171 domain-containing protein [Nitrososphaera sp.]